MAGTLGWHLTGEAMQAYAAMSNKDLQDYGKVKEAMFQRYDIHCKRGDIQMEVDV